MPTYLFEQLCALLAFHLKNGCLTVAIASTATAAGNPGTLQWAAKAGGDYSYLQCIRRVSPIAIINSCTKSVRSGTRTSPLAIPTTTVSVSTCPKCGSTNKSGKLSCCARGGAWFKKCGDAGDTQFDHTWSEGIHACKRTRRLWRDYLAIFIV